jgi:hypothetical protein
MQGVGSTVRTECFAATCPQQGRTLNEDAFLIGCGERPFAALCDGAGNAEQAARRVLRLFERLLNESTAEQILSDKSRRIAIKPRIRLSTECVGYLTDIEDPACC